MSHSAFKHLFTTTVAQSFVGSRNSDGFRVTACSRRRPVYTENQILQ